MRAFNLEEAKEGKPLVTRDGRDAKFIAHVPEALPNWRLIVMIDRAGKPGFWPESGIDDPAEEDYAGPESDLFMKTVKRTIFLNAWEDGHGNGWCRFDLKGVAIQHSKCCQSVDFIAIAVPIEIEE